MEILLITKVAAIGLLVAIMNVVLSKAGREDYALLTTLAGLIAVIMLLMPRMTELFDSIKSVFNI